MSRARVEGSGSPCQLDVKRLRIEGVHVYGECPKGHGEFMVNLGDDHLSYPSVNAGANDVPIYCSGCDDYFSVSVALKLTVEAAR